MKAKVHQYIGEHREELLGSLQTLVRVDTTNPPGRNYRAMTDALLGRCQGLDMQAKVHRVPDQEVRRVLGSDEFPRYNLIARWDVGPTADGTFQCPLRRGTLRRAVESSAILLSRGWPAMRSTVAVLGI